MWTMQDGDVIEASQFVERENHVERTVQEDPPFSVKALLRFGKFRGGGGVSVT
jgi:hypothetical protein